MQNDFLYPNPHNVVIFAENHDTNRINDFYPLIENYKQLLSVLLTLRGIPQIYYGSEIGMTGKKELGDGDIRRDFPGGWPDDQQNAFLKSERTPRQTGYFEFTKKLLQWRKTNTAVHFGKTLHYIPQNDVYVYFRYTEQERVMVVVNNNKSPQNLNLERFKEGIANYTQAIEVSSQNSYSLTSTLDIPAETVLILELSL